MKRCRRAERRWRNGDDLYRDSAGDDHRESSGGEGNGGTLVFEVDVKASKTQVKQAVEALFKVKVRAVRTANMVARNGAAASLPVIALTGRRPMCG